MQITKILFTIIAGATLLFASALADNHRSADPDSVHWGAVEAGQNKSNEVRMRRKMETGEWQANARTGDDGETPLQWAAESGSNVGVKILLEYGAAVNMKDYKGWTALHYAAVGYTKDEILQDLIAHGANPNIKTDEGHTAAEFLTVKYRSSLEYLR